MKKGRWKLDAEIGIGLAVVILLVTSVGFVFAASKIAKPSIKRPVPKAAAKKILPVVKPPVTKVTPKVTPRVTAKDLPKLPTTVRKESPASSGIPVLTAPAPTPTSGFSSDY